MIEVARLHNHAVALHSVGDEPPPDLPQQFGVGEIVTLGNDFGEIYRSAVGLYDYCETGWNADPARPSIWTRMYWVKTPNSTYFVTEAALLDQNPRQPSAAVLAYLTGTDPEQQAIREYVEMTNALWAIQRLARDLDGAWVQDEAAVRDAFAAIAERALHALGKEAATPAVVCAGFNL